MPTSATIPEFAERQALYETVIATIPGVERKGSTMPYTSMNGNMFSFLTKEGVIALRLGETDRAAFVEKYKTAPVVQHGAVMREYVAVPNALLTRPKELAKYFRLSVEHAKSLKSKPTSRKKKSDVPPKRR